MTPVFPTAEDSVTVVYNPQEGDRGLANWTGDIYAHTGVNTNLGNWRYVNAEWCAALPQRKFTRQADGTYILKMTPSVRAYYGVPAGENVVSINFVFHTGSGAGCTSGRGAGGSDIIYSDIVTASSPLKTRIVTPSVSSLLAQRNSTISFRGAASQNASLTLTDNGVQIASAANTKELNHAITVPNQDGARRVVFKATTATGVDSAVFTYIVVPAITVANPPAGMELGANFNARGDSMTLIFQAPRKQNVFVIGDFNNYQIDARYLMNKSVDGSTWWLRIGGLTPGQTYTYQYLVDGDMRVADPLSTLVLDPNNDRNIPAETFPNLPPYPGTKTSGFVSVIQPGKAAYNWRVTNFQRPAKTDLVIYELLIRDFAAKRNYQTLIDTIAYLKNLGINAIELMPVTEFDNNESWGYNPTFHMALDKFYGTPDKFKEFVDVCHQNGIAVIVDVVFNHIWGGSTLSRLYFDGNAPSTDNPWLNRAATHPFNVGYDMNHESALTKAYVERCLKFLMKEYNLDGFRFDLSKGLTQVNNPTDVGAWGRYDASRIAILKNYHNVIQQNQNGTGFYTILEHFADGAEESELAQNGMMLWANANGNYNRAIAGNSSNDISWSSARQRGWNDSRHDKHIAYMESHDEQRNMFEALRIGEINQSQTYDIRELPIALRRVEMASAFFYSIPGPRMLWQFGELGYDVSIDQGCRVCNKPVRWEYFTEPNRRRLYNVMGNIIDLRKRYPNFKTTNYSIAGIGRRDQKYLVLPHTDMDIVVLGNFNLDPEQFESQFTRTGKWYDYLSGDSITVTDVNATRQFLAGEYHIYTSKKLPRPPLGYISGRVGTDEFKALVYDFMVYPNPSVSAQATVGFSLRKSGAVSWEIMNLAGQTLVKSATKDYPMGAYQESIRSPLASGIYLVRLTVDGVSSTQKWVVE